MRLGLHSSGRLLVGRACAGSAPQSPETPAVAGSDCSEPALSAWTVLVAFSVPSKGEALICTSCFGGRLSTSSS